MKLIKCLIVEDEPSAQNVLQKFINEVPFLELEAICNNGLEAYKQLDNKAIDLIFLDIQMPKISGLNFYKSLTHKPQVIFTTAYNQYAVDGFDVDAVDFLLKPFSFERFLKAANKASDKINVKNKITDNTILIKADKKVYKINKNDILFIEAFGDYVKVITNKKKLLTNATFTSVLEKLSTSEFIKVHKSFAVNLSKIEVIEGNQIHISNYRIPIGATYKKTFLKVFNQ
jgi:DNA-binding LytR/AlgR family response regulator